MSVLDRAMALAAEERAKDDQAEATVVAAQKHRNAIVAQTKVLLFAELTKLDGHPTKRGPFRLERRDDMDQVVAYLWAADNPAYLAEGTMVGWFKVGVVVGTYDASDDCRDIEYVNCRVRARIYSPDSRRRTWDVQELEQYHGGGWSWSCSSIDELPKFFEELATQLAAWMP